MPLSMVEEGEPKTIVKVGGKEEVRKFLENLGFVDGTVVTVVSSLGGNMILNVGPDARGNFPETAIEELRKVGAWLSKNGCSIYNCGHSEIEKPEWGRYTEPLEMREDKQFRTVFAHVFEPALGALPLFGIRADALESVRLAATGSELRRGEAWNSVLYRETPLVSFGANPVYTYALPDEVDTVLVLKIRKDTGN